jgi:hypothetical protein
MTMIKAMHLAAIRASKFQPHDNKFQQKSTDPETAKRLYMQPHASIHDTLLEPCCQNIKAVSQDTAFTYIKSFFAIGPTSYPAFLSTLHM